MKMKILNNIDALLATYPILTTFSLVVIYILIGILFLKIVSIIFSKLDEDILDDDVLVLYVVCWPFLLVFMSIIGLFTILNNLCKIIISKDKKDNQQDIDDEIDIY